MHSDFYVFWSRDMPTKTYDRKHLSIVLSLVVFLFELPANSSEVYVWHDERGQWHFSDKKQTHFAKLRKVDKLTTTQWTISSQLKPLPFSRPPKGIGFLSKRERRCHLLEQKIARYEQIARSSKKSQNYLKKKRDYQWLKLKEC
jgi:hypothetical protein